jgi:Cu+-exporting ATPase
MPVTSSTDHSVIENARKPGNAAVEKGDLSSSGTPMYNCPMHPEIQQTRSGDCPKCGMALERNTVTAGTDQNENAELSDMTKRFWIGAALTLPVFVLAMAHLIPGLGRQGWVEGNASRWTQFALTIPVVS